jgi:hypothetical protein
MEVARHGAPTARPPGVDTARRPKEDDARAGPDGEQPTADLPDYAFRGVAYGAAGWSMSALASRDPLLWDYVEPLKASPGTPSAVKKELANLFTNPAFRYQGAPDNK